MSNATLQAGYRFVRFCYVFPPQSVEYMGKGKGKGKKRKEKKRKRAEGDMSTAADRQTMNTKDLSQWKKLGEKRTWGQGHLVLISSRNRSLSMTVAPTPTKKLLLYYSMWKYNIILGIIESGE